jgi:drug/metabolite transporter (DMT)-like permease
VGTIYARGRKEHHPLAVPLEMLVGGAISIGLGVVLGEASQFSFARVSMESWLGMLWLITGGAMAGYTAFAYIVRTLPAATVATYGYVNPVVAVMLGAVLFREPITWNVVAGGSAVLASVVVILFGNRRGDSPEAAALADEAA